MVTWFITQINNMKRIILLCFLSVFTLGYSQSISNVKTEYSKIENGSIGKESFSFSLYNSYINITDNDYYSKTKYGPVKLSKSGYEGGLYYLLYVADIDADPLGFYRGKKSNKGYRFVYNTKGGKVLRVDEMTVRNKQISTKKFYTKEGFENIYPPNEKSEENADFDLKDIILSSTSLTDLVGKINFSFDQFGSKKTSNDGQYITITYKNSSSIIRPQVSYYINGSIAQISFILLESDAEKIIKELILNYGIVEIDGVDLVKRDNLTYDYRVKGEIGIIVIY